MATQVQRQLLGGVDQFLPPDWRGRPKQFFGYGTVFNPIPQGATVTNGISIDNDSSFLLLQINRIVTDVSQLTLLAFVPMTLQLNYTGSGSNFFQNPAALDDVAGNAQLPGILPFPIFIPGGATFNVTLANLDPVNPRVARIDFLGCKIFPT